MPEQYETDHERAAFALGAGAGLRAASWVADGNLSPEHYARVLAMMDAGDPEVCDYLPAMPNLSGEWADGPTPHSLALDIFGYGDDAHLFENEDVKRIADAWEAGVASTFEPECERILRAMAPEPTVCAGTGDHTGQGIADCDECNPAKYEELS